MLTREQTQQLAEKVLSFSAFPECTVAINSSEQAFTRFANNGVTTAAQVNRHSVSIASTRDGRTGNTVVNDLDEGALRKAMKRSEELAGIAPVNPEHTGPIAPVKFPEIACDEATARAGALEMLPQIRAVIEISLKRKMIGAGLFERITTNAAVANKAGLFGYLRSADAKLTTTIRAQDGSSSGWAGLPSTHYSEIDGSALALAAADKCEKWRNPRRLEPGQYTVVFEPTATGDIISLMTGGQLRGDGFSARSAEEGRSFLSKRGGGTRLGDKMFPEIVTLRSDPFDPRMAGSPWSNELLPAEKINWIENGVIKNLSVDRYWASKTNRKPSPGPSSLVMEGGAESVADLIKTVERGLLVTHFWYIRFVNTQTQQYTGLTRDGLFLIENGQVTEPVMNFRFNDGPLHLLENTVRVGKAVRMRGLEGASMVAPPLVAKNFSFTSISDAV